jgi:hypothetical protein
MMKSRAALACSLSFVMLASAGAARAAAQEAFARGQTLAPVFEGWQPNTDGSFDMVFGFFNRNCEEVLHIPIGPDNNIEPDGPDRGQPTRFFPRRGKFVFRVRVPKDFGKRELVWTLTSRGKTEKAFATLKPEYILDKRITMMNEGGFGQRAGEGASLPPSLTVDGDAQRSVKVGEPLRLTVSASDDGLPKRREKEDAAKAGLMVGWLVYRGDDTHVTFDPPQFNPDLRTSSPTSTLCKNLQSVPEWAKAPLPADGKVAVTATFSQPGTYMLRAMAHDGGLKTTREITVIVSP